MLRFQFLRLLAAATCINRTSLMMMSVLTGSYIKEIMGERNEPD